MVTCVMLHGFGASGDDLVPLADEIDAPGVSWVFPEAPLEVYGAGRAWWMIELDRLDRDRRAEIPDGLAPAREHVMRIVDQIEGPVVLGGFSQGAMLALDVALHRETPPVALALMSGTLIAESIWQPRFARLAGVPVLQSHGRADPLLPFSAAEVLRDLLRAAGAEVAWYPFGGGHEIPLAVLNALGELLRSRAA